MSAGDHARAGADVSFRDITIKIPDRGCDQGFEWRHAPEAWAERFEKSQWVEFCLGRRRLTFVSSPRPCVGCVRGLGQMEKSGVSLSLCRRTFKLKGNKKFRTWSRKCFSCFGIPIFDVIYVIYIWTSWTFCVPVWICLFHIFISWAYRGLGR